MANHGQKKGLKMFIKLEYRHVCKVPQQRLKKCLESKWDVTVNKLKKLRNLCKRTSMTDLSLLSIPGTLIALKGVMRELCRKRLRVMKRKYGDNR